MLTITALTSGVCERGKCYVRFTKQWLYGNIHNSSSMFMVYC